MHFVTSLLAVGSIASLASANVGFEFPAAVPLSKRQTSGPSYECHANCGYTIQNSAQAGYCQDPKWKTLLSDCLDCALTYNIWQWYGDKVGAAAKACGLDATPKPAAGGSGATSSQAPTTTAAQTSAPATEPAHSTSEQPSQSSAPQTSSRAEGTSQVHSTTGATSHTSIATTTAKPTTDATQTNGTATTTHVQVGAAAFQKPAVVAAGAVAVFAINMI